MPWGDWQFWVVTVAAVGAIVWLGRSVLPKRRARKTELTVSAKHDD
ncbi:MAG: hypothetical protein AAF297_02935 [Planctomycetota bacterium]